MIPANQKSFQSENMDRIATETRNSGTHFIICKRNEQRFLLVTSTFSYAFHVSFCAIDSNRRTVKIQLVFRARDVPRLLNGTSVSMNSRLGACNLCTAVWMSGRRMWPIFQYGDVRLLELKSWYHNKPLHPTNTCQKRSRGVKNLLHDPLSKLREILHKPGHIRHHHPVNVHRWMLIRRSLSSRDFVSPPIFYDMFDHCTKNL
jgi:hypothetical protein